MLAILHIWIFSLLAGYSALGLFWIGSLAFDWLRRKFIGAAALALLVPAVAHASGLGDVNLGNYGGAAGLAIGAALSLFGALRLGHKFMLWVANKEAPLVTISGHPKISEALTAFEQAGFHVVTDFAKAHPDVLDEMDSRLQKQSFAEVGAWLAGTYGPEIMADLIARGETLLGDELAIVFGGEKALNDAALRSLGVGASQVVATQKSIVRLPDGALLVKPAGA